MGKLASWADKSIEYLFYALFFFVPLILWPKTSEVFEFNKMLFVYAVTILIAAAWVVKWTAQKKIIVRRTPLDLPILLFLASQILSTIFSIDTHTSLWGYYSRFHGGLVSTLAYILLYYALVTNFTKEKFSFLLYSILSSAVLVSIYGVLEHFGIDKHLWVQDVQSRVFSTLGQPNWLSAYLVALLPIPVFLALKSKDKNYLCLWSLTALLFFVTILFTKSQSGIGATILTLGAIGLYLIGKKFKAVYWIVFPLVLAAIIFKWDFVQKISPLGPANLEQLVLQDNQTRFAGSDSLVIRQVVWEGARKLGRQNPLFGTGVETFGYSYFTVRPALHNLLSEWEFLYNKAHNEYLNFLANTGFVGLAAYLFFIGTSVYLLASSPPLFFGYLSILITNYFGFSVVPVALFFFLFPALGLISSKTKERYLSVTFRPSPTITLPIVFLAAAYLLLIPLNQFRADINYNTGRLYLSAGGYKQSLDRLAKAVSLSPDEPIFLAQLAEAQAISASAVKSQLDTLGATGSAALRGEAEKTLADLISQAATNSTSALAKNPHHTNLYKSKTKVELYLGMIDPKYNQRAIETLGQLFQIAPTDAKVAYNLGLLYLDTGQPDQAKLYLQKAVRLKPDYDAAQAQLTLVQ